MNNIKWGVEVKRIFIESKRLNKKGNPETIVVDLRTLHLLGDFIGTDHFKVFARKRKGEYVFTISYLPEDKKPLWPSDLLDRKVERKWKREGSYTESQLLVWLKPYLKESAMGAVVELKTAPPDNIAA